MTLCPVCGKYHTKPSRFCGRECRLEWRSLEPNIRHLEEVGVIGNPFELSASLVQREYELSVTPRNLQLADYSKDYRDLYAEFLDQVQLTLAIEISNSFFSNLVILETLDIPLHDFKILYVDEPINVINLYIQLKFLFCWRRNVSEGIKGIIPSFYFDRIERFVESWNRNSKVTSVSVYNHMFLGVCKVCSKEYYIGSKDYTKTCGSSCAHHESNATRLLDGSHNWLKENGGSDRVSKIQRLRLQKGTHPFQQKHKCHSYTPENISSFEAKAKANKALEISTYRKKNVSEIEFYSAEFEDERAADYIKIGITKDGQARAINYDYCRLRDMKFLKRGPVDRICELEYQVKLRFSERDPSLTRNSTEAVPRILQSDMLEFVDNFII